MNWIVITIGTALVLALFAALVGPVLVDWTAYRATIEANASRFLGTEIAIDGEAELRILPSPRMRLTDVRIGSADSPFLHADAVVLDVDLAPLLSREFRVLGLKLEAPVATVSLDRAGALVLPEINVDSRFSSFFDVDHVTVEGVSVANGRINLIDARSGRASEITGIDMTGDARTLRGPFAANGEATIGGVRHELRIGAGTVDAGTMPLSVRANPADGKLALSFEGALVPRPNRLSLRGEVALESSAATPWAVRGTLSANAQDVQLQKATVRYGLAEQTLELAANATYSLVTGDPLAIALEGRQIDLDRLARSLAPADAAGSPAGTPPPEEIVSLLADYLAPVIAALDAHRAPGIPLDIELAINTVLAGGSVIRDVSAEAAISASTIAINHAEGVFPGDTTIDLAGRIADAFEGTVKVSASQPALLARWWTGTTFSRGLMDAVLLEADVRANAAGVEAQRLSVRIGESRASGRASYTSGDDAATLDVALSAPRLDLADVADAAAVLRAAGAGLDTMPEILLDLSVDEALLGGVAGASLSVDGSYRGGTLTIDAISAEDLAGARLFARGEINGLGGNPVGVIEGSLDVAEGAPLAAAIRAFAPGDARASAIAARVEALAPASLDVALTGRPGEGAADLSLALEGTLGGTALTVNALSGVPGADWAQSPTRLTLDASNENGATLLRQFGLDAAENGGPASLSINLSGEPGAPPAGRIRFSGFSVDATFDGEIGGNTGFTPTGRIAVTADDPSALAAVLGTPLPATGAIDLAATVARDGTAIAIDALKGEVGGVPVTGDLIADLSAAPATLRGALALGEADLAGIASLILGSEAAPSPEGIWPTGALGGSLLPDADIALAIAAERLTAGAETAEGATFDFAADGDTMRLKNLRGRVAGGTLTGQLEITRRGAAADIDLSLALDNADLPSLVWAADGAPVAAGRVSLTAEAAGSGYTVAGIVGSLAGEGSLHLRDAAVRGLSGAPFALLAAPPEGDAPAEAAVEAAFAQHLAGGTRAVPALDVPLDIAAGTVRIKDASVSGAENAALATASIDLATFSLQSDWTMALDAADGTGVTAAIRFAGPLRAPVRTVDVSAISAWLSLKALERQVEAVEAQNAELEAEAERVAPGLPGDEATPAAPDEETAPDGIADIIEGEQNGTTPETPDEPVAPFDMDGDAPATEPPLPPEPPDQRTSLPTTVQTAAADGDTMGRRVGALDDALRTYEAREADRRTVRADLLRRLGVDPRTVDGRALPEGGRTVAEERAAAN